MSSLNVCNGKLKMVGMDIITRVLKLMLFGLSDDLKLHIPLLHYSPLPNDKAIMLLSIDMKIKDFNQLLFKVVDYKVIK